MGANNARNRSFRIQTLVKLAMAGQTYEQLIEKARSWNISGSTARDYMKTVSAICKNRGQVVDHVEDYAGKPNPYDPDEIVVGRGSDIIR